jgi:hypothetical protein
MSASKVQRGVYRSVEVRQSSFSLVSWNCLMFWPLGEVKRLRVSSAKEALIRSIVTGTGLELERIWSSPG